MYTNHVYKSCVQIMCTCLFVAFHKDLWTVPIWTLTRIWSPNFTAHKWRQINYAWKLKIVDISTFKHLVRDFHFLFWHRLRRVFGLLNSFLSFIGNAPLRWAGNMQISWGYDKFYQHFQGQMNFMVCKSWSRISFFHYNIAIEVSLYWLGNLKKMLRKKLHNHPRN